MKLPLLAILLIVVSAQDEPDGDQLASQQAVMNQLRREFNQLDSDDDGGLTVLEVVNRFHQADADDDGKINFQEFLVSRGFEGGPVHATTEQVRVVFTIYDTRSGTQAADGFMVRDDIDYFFEVIDKNDDGFISLQEFNAVVLKVAEIIVQVLSTTATTP